MTVAVEAETNGSTDLCERNICWCDYHQCRCSSVPANTVHCGINRDKKGTEPCLKNTCRYRCNYCRFERWSVPTEEVKGSIAPKLFFCIQYLRVL